MVKLALEEWCHWLVDSEHPLGCLFRIGCACRSFSWVLPSQLSRGPPPSRLYEEEVLVALDGERFVGVFGRWQGLYPEQDIAASFSWSRPTSA